MSAPSKPKYDLPARDAMDSLTGFDEVAIEKAFGKEVDELGGRELVRALIFILERRTGTKDGDAKTYAMSIPMSELDGHFPPREEEIDEDDPDTEQGKDGDAVS